MKRHVVVATFREGDEVDTEVFGGFPSPEVASAWADRFTDWFEAQRGDRLIEQVLVTKMGDPWFVLGPSETRSGPGLVHFTPRSSRSRHHFGEHDRVTTVVLDVTCPDCRMTAEFRRAEREHLADDNAQVVEPVPYRTAVTMHLIRHGKAACGSKATKALTHDSADVTCGRCKTTVGYVAVDSGC